jgi:hypothetical protein
MLAEEFNNTGRRRDYIRRDVVLSPVKRCDVLHLYLMEDDEEPPSACESSTYSGDCGNHTTIRDLIQ